MTDKKKYFLNAHIIDPCNSVNEIGGIIIDEHGKIEASGKRVNKNLVNSIHKHILRKIKPDLTFILKVDINKAIKTLNKLGKYNFSQGTVVRNNKIIAIEGKGGTDKMLRQCKSKKYKNRGVLVKFPKKKQDIRVDLPTVGLKTLKQCKTAGLKGIVLKSKKNVFLERKKSIIFSNKNKMFVTVI